jgi:hypothetical protein
MDPELPIEGGLWLALFPLTFILHFAEENWAGGGYVKYLYRLRGVRVSHGKFLGTQAFGFLWFSSPIVWWWLAGTFPFVLVLLISGFMFCNGISHTVTAIWDRHYGPGLVASILLWIPLGSLTIALLYGYIPAWEWAIVSLIGMGMNIGLGVATMMSEKIFNRGTAGSR